jgi:transposase
VGAPSLRNQLREALGAIDRLQAEKRALQAENRALRAEVERLVAENRRLVVENEGLRDRVARLEAEAKKDSSNSSKPPSTDPVGPRQSRAERRAQARAAKRRPGKQPGSPGANLCRREPDVVMPTIVPSRCSGCGGDLGDGEVVDETRRQVIDLPPVRPIVTDYVVQRRRCRCGTETVGEFPPEARAPVCFGPEVRAVAVYLLDRQHLPVERTAELLNDLLGVPVSTGWLCQIQAEAAGRLYPFITELKDRLGQAPVVHADETGTRVRTIKHWMHTLSTNLLTLIAVHPRRGREALEDIGVLACYTGTIVHDGYASYDLYEEALHAQCGAHLLRHLNAVGQTATFAAWTEQMTKVLLDAKDASEHAAEAGLGAVDPKVARRLRRRYQKTLDLAFTLLPAGAPPPRRHTGGWSDAQRKAWNLATRMRNDVDQILRILDDTRVAFDNNEAERSLRMVKLHDKISGCFHSREGAEAFAAIRSYLQTAAKHGENLLGALHQLFTTGPWLPPAPAGP